MLIMHNESEFVNRIYYISYELNKADAQYKVFLLQNLKKQPFAEQNLVFQASKYSMYLWQNTSRAA